MIPRANYHVLRSNAKSVTLMDDGPWDRYRTITNDADKVVADMLPSLNGRRLFYVDCNGDLTELCITNAAFAGFGMGDELESGE